MYIFHKKSAVYLKPSRMTGIAGVTGVDKLYPCQSLSVHLFHFITLVCYVFFFALVLTINQMESVNKLST